MHVVEKFNTLTPLDYYSHQLGDTQYTNVKMFIVNQCIIRTGMVADDNFGLDKMVGIRSSSWIKA